MTERAEITLEINEQEFDFDIDVALVTKYFNGLTQSNKVAPSYNLLMNTVKQEQKARLKPLLVHPRTTMEIASALVEEFQPTVEVTVKKRSSALTD